MRAESAPTPWLNRGIDILWGDGTEENSINFVLNVVFLGTWVGYCNASTKLGGPADYYKQQSSRRIWALFCGSKYAIERVKQIGKL